MSSHPAPNRISFLLLSHTTQGTPPMGSPIQTFNVSFSFGLCNVQILDFPLSSLKRPTFPSLLSTSNHKQAPTYLMEDMPKNWLQGELVGQNRQTSTRIILEYKAFRRLHHPSAFAFFISWGLTAKREKKPLKKTKHRGACWLENRGLCPNVNEL